jgi:hypothetical protein
MALTARRIFSSAEPGVCLPFKSSLGIDSQSFSSGFSVRSVDVVAFGSAVGNEVTV